MEEGELQARKAFEEVTTKNVRTMIDYSTETRKLQRELEEKVVLQEKQLRQLKEIIDDLRKLLVNVQVEVFSGGTD